MFCAVVSTLNTMQQSWWICRHVVCAY